MRWFRRPSTSPRLLSHANLTPELPPDPDHDQRHNDKKSESLRKSRIDGGNSWQRNSSEDSENEALHCYSVQTRLVVVDKPRRWRSEPRSSSSSAEDISDRVARREAFILASREKRHPLLDHVKDTRLSCFPSSELLTQFPNETEASSTTIPVHTEKYLKNPKMRKRNTNTNESFNGNSCFSAKLKAITDRYLKCSSNGFFTKMYKNTEGSEKPGHHSRKQRSFSFGSLPGLESFQDRENPVFFEGAEVTADTEDCDSGIIISDTSSLMNSKSVYHGRSASGDQSSSPSKSSIFTDSRSSWSSDQSRRSYKTTKRKKVSRRSASLDRREIIRKYQTGSMRTNYNVNEQTQECPKPDVSCKRIFKVVRLLRSTRNEEIGIFIAKTKFCGDGVPGYLIAHIVPDGLAEREGSLHVGDEIVNVNGRRLRGLNMATAREVLCSGPLEVDIVVARAMTDTLTETYPRSMRESSVDYENVVLKPRVPEPAAVPTPIDCRIPFTPTRTSSPIVNRSDNFKAGNSMNPKMLRRALISYAGPESATPETTRVTTSCENLLDGKGPFCTLPRLPKSSICSFHTVILEKGPGKKSLGFTIVGGKDSPRGPLGIFVKSILEGGQAADAGLLCIGDEILAVNGHVCHDLTHTEAVAIFKKVKIGPLALHICRRAKSLRPPIKTKSCADLLTTVHADNYA